MGAVRVSQAGRAFGQAAEAAAEQYLRRKGFHILGRNKRSVTGELDLIAETGGVLVFVEVKARRTGAYGGAVYAVDRRKQGRLVRLAAQYLSAHRLRNRLCRFDVVLYDGGPGELGKPDVIEHIENAFEVPGEDLRW
jgi:putative endonuclease